MRGEKPFEVEGHGGRRREVRRAGQGQQRRHGAGGFGLATPSIRACLISALWRAWPASLAMASHGLVAEGNACCLIDMFLVSQVWM